MKSTLAVIQTARVLLFIRLIKQHSRLNAGCAVLCYYYFTMQLSISVKKGLSWFV